MRSVFLTVLFIQVSIGNTQTWWNSIRKPRTTCNLTNVGRGSTKRLAIPPECRGESSDSVRSISKRRRIRMVHGLTVVNNMCFAFRRIRPSNNSGPSRSTTTQHAVLITNQGAADLSSHKPDLVTNSDGSVSVYFGPVKPANANANWIKTLPGKGWFPYFRFYAPTEAYFDKSWQLNDIEPLK